MGEAIAIFERTIVSLDTPFDHFRRGYEGALSPAARRGLELFYGPSLGCSRCHAGRDLDRPSDEMGHVMGPPGYYNVGLYNTDGRGAYPSGNLGLLEVTSVSGDMGKFRTPPLRNVEYSGPYMHDGTVATLREAILVHTEGGRNVEVGEHLGDGRASPLKDARLQSLPIDEADLQALEVFLRALTDDAFLTNPELGDPFGR